MTSSTTGPDGTYLPDTITASLSAVVTPCQVLDTDGRVLFTNPAGEKIGAHHFAFADWPSLRDAAPIAPAALPVSALYRSIDSPTVEPSSYTPPRQVLISRIGEGANALFLLQAPVDEPERARLLGQAVHDIRTELQTIVAAADMLGRPEPDDAPLHDSLSSAASRALTLITEVLDQARTEYRPVAQKDTDFSVAALLRDTVARLSPLTRRNGNVLVTDIADPPDGPRVFGSAASLEALTTNLLSNAAKFTHDGTIRVALTESTHSDDPTRRAFILIVQDTGIGISETGHAYYPSPFHTETGKLPFSGTGIGTHIIQQAIAALDGKLQIESRPGKGSRFTINFSLPLAISEAGHDADPAEVDRADDLLAGANLLVVEDNDVNRSLFERCLSNVGAAVSVAPGGRDAFDLLTAKTAGYDLVLLDLEMPDIDGFALVIRLLLREDVDDTPLPMPRIVALSGHQGENWSAACDALGIETMIEKPIGSHMLCRRVASLLAEPAPITRQPRPTAVLNQSLFEELREDMGEEIALSLAKRALDEARSLRDQILLSGVTQKRREAIHSALGSSGLTGLAMVEHALRVIQAVSRLRPDESQAMRAASDLLHQTIERTETTLLALKGP
ncbi:ATP-binding response regulator [Aquicoccus porphyridii]|uniref:ATP-binding response regulator n=1 Tax=Aquicoccus porphyridii TaxID=1852029 RepID=UPI00273FA910|nr:hybrid sensor histidine kinase/response regulator [Aquicoccus porphyridii]